MKLIIFITTLLGFSIYANAGTQNFTAACEAGPITFTSECYPEPGVHIRGAYDEAYDCAKSKAMTECWNSGSTSCAVKDVDNGVAVGNQCRVTAYVEGNSSDNSSSGPALDPVITALRASFTAATKPTPAALKLGRDWSCTTFSGSPGYSPSAGPALSFEQDGVLFKNISRGLNSANEPTYYALDIANLIGIAPSGNSTALHFAIRVDANGGLIGEESYNFTGDTSGVAQVMPPAIYNAGYFASAYFTCKSRE